ncbi:HetZ-related protein 2 [Lusitaniella coriacea LEGE 07157]|uniref:HetZ-related protein 2 n=1 Tax=Lusitaniella coriacea LEGE 07157 TaxID=945747 RepID=A0A8J7JBL9_9CYAN|nr:HetZ-related protein 2 [Lusitaniella coriacea LEGE 07157]
MQTLRQGLEEFNLMTKLAVELETAWRDRLLADFPQQSPETRTSIVRWLLGGDLERFERLNPKQEEIAKQAMEYRYRILRQRYLGTAPTQAYRRLISRLGSLVMLRNKIRTWVALSRDRNRAVADVLQEIVQEMLNSDRYIQSAITWIGQCTQDKQLKNALLLTSIEEYCLRPIRNKPLLVYRFVNFLRRSQRGGLTQVPQQNIIRMISEEVTFDETDSPVSLLDTEAVANYQEMVDTEEQQVLRQVVQQEFERYLTEKVDPVAVDWLRLYLQGRSQEAISKKLNLPIKQVYRLREKVSYHAIKVFTIKNQPELVANWLQTSLKEHNLGLTPRQWDIFWQSLTPLQRQLIEQLKADVTLEEIAQTLDWKTSKVMSEWTQIYQAAQALRTNN